MPQRVAHTAKEAIEALGGVAKVAQLCGVSTNAPYNWFWRGIPTHHRHVIEPRLDAVGVQPTKDVFWRFGTGKRQPLRNAEARRRSPRSKKRSKRRNGGKR